MEKEYINAFAVIYRKENEIGQCLFVGSVAATHEFVFNLIDGLQEYVGNSYQASILEIVDLSQGFYRSNVYNELLEECLEKDMFQKVLEIDSNFLFDESDFIPEGTYYFPVCDLAESYRFLETDLSEVLYPM